jgi:hypothetical protein
MDPFACFSWLLDGIVSVKPFAMDPFEDEEP